MKKNLKYIITAVVGMPIIGWSKVGDFVFLLTNILFCLIPVALILTGSLLPIVILASWFFSRNINLNDSWLIFLGPLISWVGFKWDDVVIDYYPTTVERKKNEERRKLNQKIES